MMKKNKMNLMIIVPTLECGGQEKVASLTANYFSDDYNVIFVIFSSLGQVYNVNTKLICLNLPATNGIWRKGLNLFRRILKLRKIKKVQHIDISISFGNTANLANALSKRREKVVCSLRGNIEADEDSILSKIVYFNTDAIVCVSEKMRHVVSKHLKKINKIHVIYNPYDYEKIEELGLTGGELDVNGLFSGNIVISVGRLDKVKGYQHLINAVSIAKKEIGDLKLILIGDGNQKAYLEKIVKTKKMENDILFLGYKSNPYYYIKRSKIYVLSSLAEGFPNALVEAMLCGTPVIATNCISGPSEILDEQVEEEISGIKQAKYGILVPRFKYEKENDCEDTILAEAIIMLLKNGKLRKLYSNRALNRVKDFNIENYKKRYKELFDSIS